MRKASTKTFLSGNVYETALDRIRWLYDEFDNRVAVSSSGGKDSTVVVFLALTVARERGALPLKVQWLDQECEFDATVRYQSQMADHPDIDFEWYQIPFRLFNATNHDAEWLNVWGEGEEWVRPKDPRAIHENTFGTDRFVDLLQAIGKETGGVTLTGVRSEESPGRRLGMTGAASYRWATWGSRYPTHHVMHPIYDWTYRDVWKAIYDGDDPEHPGEQSWPYNSMYDLQHRYGVHQRDMRVSNYHHETAIKHLFYLQEAEPETWEKATARLEGISTAGHLGTDDFYVKELPFMFGSWVEYHAYLVEHLITDPEHRQIFRKQFDTMARTLPYLDVEKIAGAAVQHVIANDLYGTKAGNFIVCYRDAEADAAWRAAHPKTPETVDAQAS